MRTQARLHVTSRERGSASGPAAARAKAEMAEARLSPSGVTNRLAGVAAPLLVKNPILQQCATAKLAGKTLKRGANAVLRRPRSVIKIYPNSAGTELAP